VQIRVLVGQEAYFEVIDELRVPGPRSNSIEGTATSVVQSAGIRVHFEIELGQWLRIHRGADAIVREVNRVLHRRDQQQDGRDNQSDEAGRMGKDGEYHCGD